MARLDERISPPSPGGAEGTSKLDNALSLRGKQEQLAHMQQNPPGSVSGFDVLKSPESLIKLGLALAGGLSGNKDLQALGAGLGLGTLQAAPQVAGQATEGARTGHIEQMDKLIGQIEKDQQLMAQLLTQQPSLFLTDDGENAVEPDEWRDLMGLSVPLSPAAINKNRRLDKLQEQRLEAYGDMLNKAIASGNEPMAVFAAQGVNTMMGLNFTDEELRGLARTEDEEGLLTALLPHLDAMSVVESYKSAKVNGGSMFDAQNNVLMAKTDTTKLPTLTDTDEILAAEGLIMMGDAWNELSAEERAQYVGEQGANQFADLVLSQSPAHKIASFSKLTELRTGDILEGIKLEQLGKVTEYVNSINSMRLLDSKLSKAEFSRLITQIYANISGNMDLVQQVEDAGRAARMFAVMSQEQRDAYESTAMSGEEVELPE